MAVGNKCPEKPNVINKEIIKDQIMSYFTYNNDYCWSEV